MTTLTSQKHFTQESIDRAVRKRILASPIILYSGVAASLAGLSAALFASPLTLGLAVAGPVLLLAGWQFEKRVRARHYSLNYLEEANLQLQSERTAKTAQLVEKLREVRSRQGIHQIRLLNGKFRNFQEILAQKFSPGELTYGRYLGIAEQVFLASLDNLERVFLALKSIATVDPDEQQQRLQELERDDSKIAAEEAETLRQRLKLRQEQIERVQKLLLQNEKALTEIDHVTTQVATVVTEKGRAELALEPAMEELRRLAERAQDYTQH
ncbi:MAG: hypothetical protein PHE55_17560 [Methylococcaceae bacterium]|nr:hypothetical protein [Methylococcaceae bacterium]